MVQIFLLFIGIFILWYFNSNQCVCIDTFSIGGQNTLITDKNIRTAIQLWLTDESSARKEYGDISHWDTSEVTDMSGIFQDASAFNGNISEWKTSNVIDMRNMFQNAIRFNNGKLKGQSNTFDWNTTKVKDMSNMFYEAISFNADINTWDTSGVTDMSSMFQQATSFNNGKLKGQSNTFDWNTSSVTDMSNMFNDATSFNGDISGWNTSNVTTMSGMFITAASFNGDISGWKTSSVRDMSGMFQNATRFNADISGWDTSRVNDMVGMFNYATNFNNGKLKGQSYTFDWNVQLCENMNSMFANATSFNGDISSWKAEPINRYYSMVSMFENATSFNGNLDCWDTRRASDQIDWTDMFTGSKIGNSKNDPISSGCWHGLKDNDNATCNDCEKYNCDGNTGNCVKSFNGSFSDKVSCEKEGCLTKIEFNENYCNNDTAFTYCNHRTNQEYGCTEDILTDRNNKPIPGYTSNNYCVPLPVQHDFMCVPKCNPDINGCKRQEHHDFINSGCTNSDVKHDMGVCKSGYDENLTDNNSLCKWDGLSDCYPEPNNICV